MLYVFDKLGLEESKPSIYYMLKSMSTEDNNEHGVSFNQFLMHANEYFNERMTMQGL